MARRLLLIFLAVLGGCKQEDLLRGKSGGIKWEHPASLQNQPNDSVIRCTEKALKPVLRSDTTSEAVKGIDSAANSGDVVIIAGHGNIGYICTGPAPRISDCPAIGWWNNADWEPLIDKLQTRKLGKIRLVGCGVGSGRKGRDLIVALAKHANCPVAAPTDLVHCEDGILQLTGSMKWREADPSGNVTEDTTPRFEFGTANAFVFNLDGVPKRVP